MSRVFWFGATIRTVLILRALWLLASALVRLVPFYNYSYKHMSIAVDAEAPSSAFRVPFAGARHSIAAWPAKDHAAIKSRFITSARTRCALPPAAHSLPRVSRSHFISEIFPHLCGVCSPDHEVAARALTTHAKGIGAETMIEGG